MFLNKSNVWKRSIKAVKHSPRLFSLSSARLMATNVDQEKALSIVRQAIPPLLESKYKGQAGRVGVIGGSKEYVLYIFVCQ